MSLKITFAILASAITFASFGQAQNVSICKDNAMNSKLVTLDEEMEQRGFKLVQYQMMNMPSGAFVPVTVKLEKDKMYQFNFLASGNYSQYTVTLVDETHKKWIDQKVKQKDNKAMFSQSFAAPATGNYIVILTQKVKGQNEACGGLSILKAVNDHLPGK